jgi:hypothetical protein
MDSKVGIQGKWKVTGSSEGGYRMANYLLQNIKKISKMEEGASKIYE